MCRRRLAITLHRLFGSLLILAFGITKAVLSLKGNALAGTTLDWIVGVFLALFLYWLGVYEAPCGKVAPGFFQEDYSRKVFGKCLDL
ncbi:hypothetical protein DL93DRAFT_2061068 [Clavulina sp. PMI_390]|nr:hypothetical protein DL93DRAFT_2061068 [Clavulina sp. PMI_390]